MDTLNYPVGTPVMVRKLAAVCDADFVSASWAEWVPGEANQGKSLPVAYHLEGTLLLPVVVGLPILIYRTSRNGVKAPGLFRSSPVRSITEWSVSTCNSVYLIQALGEN